MERSHFAFDSGCRALPIGLGASPAGSAHDGPPTRSAAAVHHGRGLQGFRVRQDDHMAGVEKQPGYSPGWQRPRLALNSARLHGARGGASMPLKLIPPGRRKGNPFYIVRGRFLGNDVEVSAETKDEIVAQRFKNALEKRILDGRVPGPEEEVKLHDAADMYKAARCSSKRERDRVDRLMNAMANKPVRSVIQADVDSAASILHPGDSNETRNRNVYTPAAAILHYGYENKWCDWQRLKRPKQKDAETRAATTEALRALYGATKGKERLLIVWLFKHGTRITNALQVDCGRIDLRQKTYELYVTKNRSWKTFIIDDEVWELLANDKDVQRGEGLLFPWKSRWRVYDWLSPLRERLGVKFTPHMGRHWLGKSLNTGGAGLRTIMGALGQKSTKSAIRYVAEDIEVVRSATRALGKTLGKRKLSGRKS